MQKVSLIDYPGKIATVLFTRGCQLRCGYCHNPELVLPELYQGPISENYIFEFLELRRGSVDGVVITGGEPAIHSDLLQFMKRIKEMGYLIKLDSSGILPDVLEAAVRGKLVDYIAMDIKATEEKYQSVTKTGINFGNIRRSISIIKNSGVDYEFRTTVVKQKLTKEDIVCIAKMISGSKRYVLQRFSSSVTLDHAFKECTSYEMEELMGIIPDVERYVGSCSIR